MYKTTLGIDGMICSMCESHVNSAIRNAVNVKKVASDHRKGETVVLTDESPDINALRAAVEQTGYRVTRTETEELQKKGWTLFRRK